MLPGGEDAVDVGDFQSGVPDGVGDRFDVQRELALVRQGADLVALVDADDRDRIRQLTHLREVGHRAPPAGWNIGSVTSSVCFSKTTSTGMSQRRTFGSAATLIRLLRTL